MKPTWRYSLLHGIARLSYLLIGLIPIAFARTSAISLQQKPTDLLVVESRAIFYSGFRPGQHPDRSTGAINPNDAKILEDL